MSDDFNPPVWVENPEAVGDPDQTPQLRMTEEAASVIFPHACDQCSSRFQDRADLLLHKTEEH